MKLVIFLLCLINCSQLWAFRQITEKEFLQESRQLHENENYLRRYVYPKPAPENTQTYEVTLWDIEGDVHAIRGNILTEYPLSNMYLVTRYEEDFKGLRKVHFKIPKLII